MLSEALLPEFDHEMATTRRVLERVPDDAFGWRPHDKSWTLRELATHVANIPTWVGATIDRDDLDLSQDFEAPEPASRDALLAVFDANIAAARLKLEGASDENLMGTWTLKAADEVLLAMPRAGVLRAFVMNHLIHHRGQLTVYLRLRDVPLPSVYGPSADDQTFG